MSGSSIETKKTRRLVSLRWVNLSDVGRSSITSRPRSPETRSSDRLHEDHASSNVELAVCRLDDQHGPGRIERACDPPVPIGPRPQSDRGDEIDDADRQWRCRSNDRAGHDQHGSERHDGLRQHDAPPPTGPDGWAHRERDNDVQASQHVGAQRHDTWDVEHPSGPAPGRHGHPHRTVGVDTREDTTVRQHVSTLIGQPQHRTCHVTASCSCRRRQRQRRPSRRCHREPRSPERCTRPDSPLPQRSLDL